MKKIILIIFILLYFIGCIKKEESSLVNIIIKKNETNEDNNKIFNNDIIYVISPNGLYLRSEPNITSERKKLLPLNTELILLDRSEEKDIIDNLHDYWYKVEVNSDIGWVFGGYIDNNIIISESESIYYIRLSNCTITTEYHVPNINNIIGGSDDYPLYHIIGDNSIEVVNGSIQIILKKDIMLQENLQLIAKNGNREFTKNLNLNPIIINDEILGYYENIIFENKFWLVKNNEWLFMLKNNNDFLINKQLVIPKANSLLFKELDETPFIVNNQKRLNLYTDYTYRCEKENVDIIIIYYTTDWSTYSPIIYLIPNNTNYEYVDIGISWIDEKAKGVYFINNYKFDELPLTEMNMPIFKWLEVK